MEGKTCTENGVGTVPSRASRTRIVWIGVVVLFVVKYSSRGLQISPGRVTPSVAYGTFAVYNEDTPEFGTANRGRPRHSHERHPPPSGRAVTGPLPLVNSETCEVNCAIASTPSTQQKKRGNEKNRPERIIQNARPVDNETLSTLPPSPSCRQSYPTRHRCLVGHAFLSNGRKKKPPNYVRRNRRVSSFLSSLSAGCIYIATQLSRTTFDVKINVGAACA